MLERGGELADARAERATVTVTAGTITVWGMTEVPDGSRLQISFAGVNAVTRAELLKAVEVRVAFFRAYYPPEWAACVIAKGGKEVKEIEVEWFTGNDASAASVQTDKLRLYAGRDDEPRKLDARLFPNHTWCCPLMPGTWHRTSGQG